MGQTKSHIPRESALNTDERSLLNCFLLLAREASSPSAIRLAEFVEHAETMVGIPVARVGVLLSALEAKGFVTTASHVATGGQLFELTANGLRELGY